jgi:hypothetical protein
MIDALYKLLENDALIDPVTGKKDGILGLTGILPETK